MSIKYICHKRFKGKAICGEVNIPAMTECEELNGIIFYNGYPVCAIASENAHKHFTQNGDGQGMARGRLTQEIQKTLAKRDKNHQTRWNKIWDDALCQKYKRKEHKDFWVWNHDFYNACIFDLKYIASLIDAKL